MRKPVVRGFLVCALMLPLFCTAAAGAREGRSAREILNRVDDLFRGASSHGRMTMKVVTPHYVRELTLEAWSKGKDRSLVRILSPRKERGVATLRCEENVWNYLPKVSRVLKVPSSMMGGSWMGSHFTNDDLVRGSRLAEHYASEVSFEGERAGLKVIELTLSPRENAPVVWGKVVVAVEDKDLLPLEIRYHDEEQQPARTLVFQDKKDIGGRPVPCLIRMVPAGEPGSFTEIRYHDLCFDIALEDHFFSLANLERQGQR